MDALSRRRLAAELRVNPMAIYRLPGKGAVLSGMVEMVYGEMRAPADAAGAWQDLLRENARPAGCVTRKHPNLVLHLVSSP